MTIRKLQTTIERFFTIGSLLDIVTTKFMYLFKQENLPEEFNIFVKTINHNHFTRSTAQQSYKLAQSRTDLGKSSIKFQGVKVWNNLPTYIKEEANKKQVQ